MMIRSLNYAVIEVLQQGCIFLDRIGDETYARPLEDPATFSVWWKAFAPAWSTTISGAGTRNWKVRSRVRVWSQKS